MIEQATTERIVSSQSLIASQLDQSIILSFCSPFPNQDISLTLAIAQNVIIPNILANIKCRNDDAMKKIPQVTNLIVDNFGRDGLSLVMQNIVPEMLNVFKATSSNKSRSLMTLIKDTISAMPDEMKDDAFVGVISKASSDNEVKLRILAAFLIPFVGDHNKVLCFFRSLSLDRVPQVRCELIKSMPNCKFDQSLLQYVLLNAAKDQNPTVRKTAATVFGKIAPKNVTEFCALLEDQETTRMALRSMKEMVIENGFAPISESFYQACYIDPELSAALVLNISRVVKEEEKKMVLDFAKLLMLTNTIIEHLYKFSEVFSDKEFFVDMLMPDFENQPWRSRKAMIEQAKLFIPILKEKLVPVATKFSQDPVAIIRNLSVSLWIDLIHANEDIIENAKKLINEKWQTRLVLAKIINELGQRDDLEDTLVQLSHDEISNIRFCIASHITDMERFEKLFGDTSDEDILSLRQQ